MFGNQNFLLYKNLKNTSFWISAFLKCEMPQSWNRQQVIMPSSAVHVTKVSPSMLTSQSSSPSRTNSLLQTTVLEYVQAHFESKIQRYLNPVGLIPDIKKEFLMFLFAINSSLSPFWPVTAYVSSIFGANKIWINFQKIIFEWMG